jgi:hypothetical protein
MSLENNDIALTIYVTFMIFALLISYCFASTMIKKTGLFGLQTFSASAINFVLGICAILGWFFFSWGVNEFMFFGGLMLGLGMLAVSEAILVIALFVKRKQILQSYNDNLDINS